MEQLTRDDAIGFYRRFYGPNGAVVVIAGDVEPEQVLALAMETYGKIERNNNIMPRLRALEPPPVAARRLTMADARTEQPVVQRDYLVPSFATAERGESQTLELLAHIVGAGTNSRLYRALVVDKQIAVAAGGWYDSFSLGMSKFGVYASPRPGVTLPDIEKAIDAVLAEVIAKGVTAEELERSKTKLIADAVYTHDSQAGMARWYGSALTTGATVNDVNHWPDRIRAVTVDQVQQAARKWLDLRRSVTGYLIKDNSPQAEKRS
jgi:zinc protease